MTCITTPSDALFPRSSMDTSDPEHNNSVGFKTDDDNLLIDESDYHIVSELGSGLQGRVELAIDKHNQRLVALKLPTFETREGTDEVDLQHLDCQVQSIILERDAMRLVRHDNVLRVLRSVPGHKNHHIYVMLVMEYAPNGDLFDIISQTGALPEIVTKYYFHQLLLGVQACHDAGVIHRDIKPENLLFDDQFQLKICDFGLASIVESSQDATLDDMEGTSLYMAPEMDGMTPFRATPVDLWACGVVLFIMLTGFPPFEVPEPGDASYDLLLSGDTAGFWASQPETIVRPSQEAMELVSGLLQVDPERRLSVSDALAHAWFDDAHKLDTTAIIADMQGRRSLCTAALHDD